MRKFYNRLIGGSLVFTAIFLVLIVFGLCKDISVGAGENCYRIGAVYMTMNNPFYTVVDKQIQLKVESQGDILLTRDSALNQQRQNEQIQTLLEEDIDLLIVNPVDWKAITPALQAVHQKGIPIIAVDAPVFDDTLIDCTIVSDNYDAGVQCANDLMKRRESARIFLLEHQSAKSAMDRIQGFVDTLAEYPQYEIVDTVVSDGQLEIAMPETEKLLNTYGSVDVIMALNDPSALGALAALEEYDLLGSTLVYGVDGTPEAKSLIQEGIMTATAAQSVYQMSTILGDTVYDVLEGKEIEKTITVPVQLITADNVAKYSIDGWQ